MPVETSLACIAARHTWRHAMASMEPPKTYKVLVHVTGCPTPFRVACGSGMQTVRWLSGVVSQRYAARPKSGGRRRHRETLRCKRGRFLPMAITTMVQCHALGACGAGCLSLTRDAVCSCARLCRLEMCSTLPAACETCYPSARTSCACPCNRLWCWTMWAACAGQHGRAMPSLSVMLAARGRCTATCAGVHTASALTNTTPGCAQGEAYPRRARGARGHRESGRGGENGSRRVTSSPRQREQAASGGP